MRLEGLKEHEPLSKHVHIRIGGPARFYFEAKTSDEIVRAVAKAEAGELPWAIIGGGSNTLPSDDGFDGLVIQAANHNWKIDGNRVVAEAGMLSILLARKTAETGLTGFEWAASLPGTIGGAVRGNAGCFGGETKDVVESAEVLRDGKRMMLTNSECGFGYRDSIFKHNKDVILSVTLKLRKATKEECIAKLDAVLTQRKADQPSDAPSAGCMFKNFEYKDGADIEKLRARLAVPDAFIKAKRIPAGWLVEQADLKGKKVGGATVSDKHGNFVMNIGHASASDALQLVSLVKMKIRDEYGIQLEEEVQLLGF